MWTIQRQRHPRAPRSCLTAVGWRGLRGITSMVPMMLGLNPARSAARIQCSRMLGGRLASGQVPEEREEASDPAVHGIAGHGGVRDNPHDDQHPDDDPEDPSQQRTLASLAVKVVPVRPSRARRIKRQAGHPATIPPSHCYSVTPRMPRTTPSVAIANALTVALARLRRRQNSRSAPSSIPRIES
jgi:hypothetical protein